MPITNVEIVQTLLNDPKNPDVVNALCVPDVTYVSLNYSNPDLKKSMPWCGTHQGPLAILDTFIRVGEYWNVDAFEVQAAFGEGENVAIFGKFTYTSVVLKKTVTSPFAVFCKLNNGKITYMQFMEDTFATSASFRSSGTWKFQSDPLGAEVEA